MAVRLMTLLTQERWSLFEQVGDICAMGVVTKHAALCHRLMIPDKWPAFFRMTLVAGIDHRIAFHQAVPG